MGAKAPLLFAIGFAVAAAGWAQGPVDFAREIQPVLARSCHPCHGPTLQGGNLRLDGRQTALRGGVSGPAILPGNAEQSPLFRRVSGLDGRPKMPLSGDRLPADVVLRIREWIDSGAPWPEEVTSAPQPARRHWAWVKPERPELPAVRDAAAVRNPIDRFVLAELERHGLTLSPEVERARLIRRVSLDLIGLPPTPDEVAAFVADTSSDAYEKVVDRLLASPRYGERWVRPWLDLARYADTNGYEKDMRRTIWPWRDWVIDALNRDMPFDRFTIEQLAGDLLPEATVDQRVATGFHRNSMINEEGGIDPEEYRVAAVMDRVNTTATVWLGATIGCAQCHNHKFDPFTQEEYYRLFAFFNSTSDEIRVTPGGGRFTLGPNLSLPAPRALASHRRQAEDQIALLEKIAKMPTQATRAQQVRWEAETKASLLPWEALQTDQVTTVSGASAVRLEDRSVVITGAAADRDTYIVTAHTSLQGARALRLEVLADPGLPGRGISRGEDLRIALTGVEVEAGPEARQGLYVPVPLSEAAAESGSNPKGVLDDDPSTGWSVSLAAGAEGTQLVLVAREQFGYGGGTRLRIRLRHESSDPGRTIGRFRISLTSAPDAARSVKLPAAIQAILAQDTAGRSAADAQRLEEYYLSISPLLAPVREWRDRLRDLWAELAHPSTFVMKELPEPRKSWVFLGGSFLSHGKEVTPGVPAVLNAFPKDAPANRLGLAQWLVDPENPLTARVTMNRAWMEFFGRGIVETAEDFGTQGRPPTNQALLDWLACEFVARKWSVKAMHRLIVTSATYRQNAAATAELIAQDPANVRLARSPRPRLEAELIRDSALAVAGLLSPKMGGPSVFPFQPEGIWNLVYNDDKWRISDGEDRYRRGIYTFWRRTAPYPMFTAFDAPSRELTCTRRVATNTPLQSLTILNDPVFVDAARGLARRVLLEGPSGTAARVAWLFRLCLAREPGAKEIARLESLVSAEAAGFRRAPASGEQLSNGGDVRPPQGADAAEFAAWTVAANVILNLDEFLTRP